MSEVVEPFSLIWENVDFIPEKSQGNQFLNFLSCGGHSKEVPGGHVPLIGNKGMIRQGELVALMGPSGSGKSTLLKCLALGRNHTGFQGIITLTGLPDGVPLRGRIINQDDKEHLILTLTVRESLRYASQLKNLSASQENHMEYVRGCLGYLGLEDVKDKLVENCSGGTTKRLALGLELIAVDKPHFLLLDEPISGLDSHVGETLIRLLGDCAHLHRMTIITTIHQPKESVFQSFNRVFILAGDGSIIYDREPSTLRNYLEECSSLVNIVLDPGENSIDLAIKIASTRSQQDDGYPICTAMIKKANSLDTKPEFNYGDIHLTSSAKILDEGLCSVEASFTYHSFKVVLDRTFLVARRQLKFILIRFLLHAVMTGVLMTLYGREIGEDDGCILRQNSDPHGERLAGSNVKFQFFSLLFLMFASLMPTVLSFPSEIKLFLNEYRNGFYSTWTYYLAKTLVEIPLQLLFPYGYCVFIFWYFKQPGGILEGSSWLVEIEPRFGLFLFTTLICCYIAQGLGFLIGILCVHSFNISIMVASSTILFLSLYSGFFVRRTEMGVIATGANFLSFIRFGFENILISIFGKGRCTHPEKSAIMATYDLNDTDVSFNYLMLGFYLVMVRVAAFLFLKLKVSKPIFSSVGKRAGMIINLGKRRFVYTGLGEKRGSVKGTISKLVKFLAWASLAMVLVQLILASVVRIVMDMRI